MLKNIPGSIKSRKRAKPFYYVFSIKLEYSDDYYSVGDRLHPKSINLKYSEIPEELGAKLTKKVIDIVTVSVPTELNTYRDIEIKIDAISVKDGSILITFMAVIGTLLWGGYNFVSNYENFWKGIERMKLQIQKLVGRSLQKDFDDMVDFLIVDEHPIFPEAPIEMANFSGTFLWYLIITNVLLSLIIAFLVGKAVWHYYF